MSLEQSSSRRLVSFKVPGQVWGPFFTFENSPIKVNLECGKTKFEIHECKPVGDFPPIPEKRVD